MTGIQRYFPSRNVKNFELNLNPISITGGTITQLGQYRIHTFTSTTSIIVSGNGIVEYLIIAGGGAGGGGVTYSANATANTGGGAGGNGSTTYLNGTYGTPSYGADGAANRGVGGGGTRNGGAQDITVSGSGGSGRVVFRYPDSFPLLASTTGSPTISTSGGYRIYIFNASGSVTI